MSELFSGIWIYFRRLATYDPVVTVIQLFLIGVVVWLAMRFLRGTRGARLVKGAALLLATVYLTIRLLPKSDEWKRIEFLYGNFLLFVLLAAIVAFQPEIRRALIQIGQARFFRTSRGQVEAMIDALVESATYLSRNKIGALVAIERSVPLATLGEAGTLIDARVTPALLNSIFYPGGALHDMGVIIRHNRLAAAGCQFPLAESEDVEAALGSRHRAALGLAQDSDAVVLVVSEQTARISLACDGQLYIGLGSENLRNMLTELLVAPRGQRGSSSSQPNTGDDPQ